VPVTTRATPLGNSTPEQNTELVTLHQTSAGGTGGARYNSCDAIWKHPTSGGTIYVGNVEGACGLHCNVLASVCPRAMFPAC
jgi:hypothetical protein